MKIDGGCLCGSIRYSIEADIIDAGFCHCRICQKSSGSPLLAWLTIPFSGFKYLQGNASVFQSSERYQREFCSGCGTQIAFRSIYNPKTVDITICSLDEISAVKPEYHIWCQSKVNWLHVNDELPQFVDSGPDRP